MPTLRQATGGVSSCSIWRCNPGPDQPYAPMDDSGAIDLRNLDVQRGALVLPIRPASAGEQTSHHAVNGPGSSAPLRRAPQSLRALNPSELKDKE